MRKIVTLFTFLLMIFFAGHAERPPAVVSLTPAHRQGEALYTGLRIVAEPGWHIYGPTPQGETTTQGFEPNLDAEGSLNLKSILPHWPAPHETELGGKPAYVYEGKILVPLELQSLRGDRPVDLKLQVTLLACQTLCVPVTSELSLSIDPRNVREGAPEIEEALDEIEDEFEGVSLVVILLSALLGGVILNFMPCVLPVLSLKIMGLMKHQDVVAAKRGFFFTLLGILASFLTLAGLTILAQEMGQLAGWGMHFQNVYFLNFMLIMTFLFAQSLLGVFEIHLGSRTSTWLVTHEGRGHLKEFLTGAFATLLATPCSAPFVGSAVGFALARNPADIFLIFFFIGMGFGLPYWIGMVLPARYLILPKPGRWMIVFERVLGFFLLGTSLWLGYLLSHHRGLGSVLAVYGIVTLVGGLYFYKQRRSFTLRASLLALPLLLGALLVPALTRFHSDLKKPDSYVSEEIWQPFDPQAIPALVAKGQVVFVDLTAGWCVTCALNKQRVMTHGEFLSLLDSPDVTAMRGDWTHADPAISAFLKAHNRYGIPFNAVFGPGAPEGIVLGEILTLDEVKGAFERAR